MKGTKISKIMMSLFAVVLCFGSVVLATPLGTAFTYQGRLIDNNQPADGVYNFLFTLCEDSNGDQPIWDVNIETQVNEGYFSVELDFGNVFDGNNRWLKTAVLNDPCGWITLTPLQRITPTPYALYAASGPGVSVPLILSGSVASVIDATNTGTGYGVSGYSSTGYGVYGSSNSGYGVSGYSNSGYAGYFLGKVHVTGQVRISGGSPAAGKVLTSDSVGLATWQIPAGGDSDWIIADNNMYSDVSGSVGIGTTNPNDKLDVVGHINSSESYKLDSDTVLSNHGPSNILVGKGAGNSIWTGGNNTALGYNALYSNYSSWGNTAVGSEALYTNTGSWNSAVGRNALRSNTYGSNNSAMGDSSLYANTGGSSNTALGAAALYANITGGSNSAIGSAALRFNTTGNGNTAMGDSALNSNSVGSFNTALGSHAGNNAAGNGNVFLGYWAGYNETDSNKLYIDNSSTSTPLIYGDFAANRVGINRVAAANAFEVEGNASKTTAGDWLANSDARIKTDVQTVTGALDALDKVRLVSFKYTDDYRNEHPGVEARRYLNVIAQEFSKVFPEYVRSSGEKLPSGDEILQVDAYPLTVYSAAAVQELHNIVKAKDTEIAQLKERVTKMEILLAGLLDEQKRGQK